MKVAWNSIHGYKGGQQVTFHRRFVLVTNHAKQQLQPKWHFQIVCFQFSFVNTHNKATDPDKMTLPNCTLCCWTNNEILHTWRMLKQAHQVWRHAFHCESGTHLSAILGIPSEPSPVPWDTSWESRHTSHVLCRIHASRFAMPDQICNGNRYKVKPGLQCKPTKNNRWSFNENRSKHSAKNSVQVHTLIESDKWFVWLRSDVLTHDSIDNKYMIPTHSYHV